MDQQGIMHPTFDNGMSHSDIVTIGQLNLVGVRWLFGGQAIYERIVNIIQVQTRINKIESQYTNIIGMLNGYGPAVCAMQSDIRIIASQQIQWVIGSQRPRIHIGMIACVHPHCGGGTDVIYNN